MELVYIVLIAVVVWYLGSSINAMIQKSAELASQEFAVFERDQKIRHHKIRANQTKKVKSLADLDVMSDKEFEEFFNIINTNKE
jgi:hypothetical protein